MILTVCMSPSVDVTVELDTLNVGKMNAVKRKSLSYRGKAINVAIGVRRLGYEAQATGFMYNENGENFQKELANEGILSSFIWNEGSVRENYKIVDGSGSLTEINSVGAPVRPEKLKELVETVARLSKEADVTIVSGGLPRGVDDTYYREIFEAVDGHSLRIADTEGAKLFAALEAGVDLVKPNRDELEHSLGLRLKDRGDALASCNELLDRGAKAVLLSLGREGALITDGTRTYYCKSENAAVNSTVGAGDAMVAAAAVMMREGADLSETLRAGVAAGTAAVTSRGDLSFTKKKFSEIYKGLTVVKF